MTEWVWLRSAQDDPGGELRKAVGSKNALQALILFEIEHEHGGRGGWGGVALFGHRTGPRVLANQIENPINLVLIRADHQRGVAAAEKTTCAGKPRGPELVFQQRINDAVGVLVLDDRDDQFLHLLATSSCLRTRVPTAHRIRPEYTIARFFFGFARDTEVIPGGDRQGGVDGVELLRRTSVVRSPPGNEFLGLVTDVG